MLWVEDELSRMREVSAEGDGTCIHGVAMDQRCHECDEDEEERDDVE